MKIRIKVYNEPTNGRVLAANMTAGATSFTYTGPDIAVGDTIQIEDETILVGAVNISTNTASQCFRGKDSVAVAHAAGTPVAVATQTALEVIEDTMVPYLAARFGTAQNGLDEMVAWARHEAKILNKGTARNTAMVAVADAEHTADTQFDAAWPPQ